MQELLGRTFQTRAMSVRLYQRPGTDAELMKEYKSITPHGPQKLAL
jgi:hypothetical protein